MKVHDTIPVNPEHSIEFGKSDWSDDINEESIRRRKNHSNGKFDPYSSSEISINGKFLNIAELVCRCLERDKIRPVDMKALYKELTESAKRQGISL